MQCPRCSNKTQNIVEYIIEEEDFIYMKEFYCTKCKSCVIERFDAHGFVNSEWIDFNV